MNIAVSSFSYYLIDSRKLASKATTVVCGCKIIYRFKNVIQLFEYILKVH